MNCNQVAMPHYTSEGVSCPTRVLEGVSLQQMLQVNVIVLSIVYLSKLSCSRVICQ